MTPWTAVRQASLSITNSLTLLKLMSIESVMPSNHLILYPLLLPSIFPSTRVFSNESVLHIRWPKYWSFSFTITPFKSGSINGQEMPEWWENHFQSGFVSELRDGNHLLFMPMKQQIIVMKDGKHTENCGLFKKNSLLRCKEVKVA